SVDVIRYFDIKWKLSSIGAKPAAVAPKTPTKQSKQLPPITLKGYAKEFAKGGVFAPVPGEPQPSLVGFIADYAIIDGQEMRVGGMLSNGGKIVQIENPKVVYEKNGQKQELSLGAGYVPPPPPPPGSGGAPTPTGAPPHAKRVKMHAVPGTNAAPSANPS